LSKPPGHRIGALVLPLFTLAWLAAPAPAVLAGPRAGARPRPERLADTGLYADFASRTVDPRNVEYSPQYPLWSDGARKTRWIYLPPHTSVDATDPDEWVFPVGTKLWKEFAWSRRVETRYLELTPAGWAYATYVWADDESDAVLAPERGVRSSYEVAPGLRHAVPSVQDCHACHRGGRSEVLGFGALQLSPDRDPMAPHAEPAAEGLPTLRTLAERGLVRGLPRGLLDRAPRIAAATPSGRAALGYLHANCGGCHDSVGPLASLGLRLRHPLSAKGARAEPAVATTLGREGRFRQAGAPEGSAWLRPGDPSRSTVLARMASRNPSTQMPPLGTRLVDEEAVALLRRWIEHDLGTENGADPK